MRLRRFPSLAGPTLAAAVLAGCAAQSPGDGASSEDPYEDFNRSMLSVNTELDRAILRPASQAYDFGVPETFQFLIRNEINYLSTPVDFANFLLQGEFEAAGKTLARFTLNTVMGGVGFLDPATEFGLPEQETDFGITLGKWGVAPGPFLVLPVLGPTMARGLPAYVVDRAFSPLTYVGAWTPVGDFNVTSPTVWVVDKIDLRAEHGALVDRLLYETPDPYVTLRSAYTQRRRVMVAGEEGILENLPDIYDDDGYDDGGDLPPAE